jgi:hypothetical protein
MVRPTQEKDSPNHSRVPSTSRAAAEMGLSDRPAARASRRFLKQRTAAPPGARRLFPASLRANIAETLLASLNTEQGGKDIQHEEHEDILFGPGRRAQ